jgi:hypothetical protein
MTLQEKLGIKEYEYTLYENDEEADYDEGNAEENDINV